MYESLHMRNVNLNSDYLNNKQQHIYIRTNAAIRLFLNDTVSAWLRKVQAISLSKNVSKKKNE